MTPSEQRKVEVQALVEHQHAQWLASPITLGVKGLLEQEADNLVRHMAEHSTDFKNHNADEFRVYSAQLKVIRRLQDSIFNANSFVKRTIKD